MVAPIFYLVVPCYNEEDTLPETSTRLQEKFASLISEKTIAPNSRVLFVDDGSSDSTWSLIEKLHSSHNLFSGLKLSRNRGHQNALLAGLLFSADYADVIGSMDADLQDDIDALDEMLERASGGYEVVYGVRNDRTTDSSFKRWSAQSFYKIQAKMGMESIYNHADYRLMSARAVHALGEFREVNLFLRGLVPLVGFKSCVVYYARGKRFAGESKYSLKKMIGFAIEGITSFSIKPIRIISGVGMIIALISFFALLYVLVGHFVGHVEAGWTSTIMSIWLLGGLQLLAIGVIGEYVGKTYMESKSRPRFIIEGVLNDTDKDSNHG